MKLRVCISDENDNLAALSNVLNIIVMTKSWYLRNSGRDEINGFFCAVYTKRFKDGDGFRDGYIVYLQVHRSEIEFWSKVCVGLTNDSKIKADGIRFYDTVQIRRGHRDGKDS